MTCTWHYLPPRMLWIAFAIHTGLVGLVWGGATVVVWWWMHYSYIGTFLVMCFVGKHLSKATDLPMIEGQGNGSRP